MSEWKEIPAPMRRECASCRREPGSSEPLYEEYEFGPLHCGTCARERGANVPHSGARFGALLLVDTGHGLRTMTDEDFDEIRKAMRDK